VARRFGVTCLSLLLSYKEAADLEVNPEEPGPTPIEVPDENGQVSVQPFSACSVEQMRRALQRKRKPASSKPLPAEARVLAEQYTEAVALRFPKGKGALVKVAVRNQKGKAVLDFKGIPLEQVRQLAEALTGELPSVDELPQPPLAVQPS
jgi:ribosomal protein L16/L10AE